MDWPAAHYPALLRAHVALAAASGGLFMARGVLQLCGSALANTCGPRRVSHVIDSGLLAAGILLMAAIRQYPLANSWLTIKMGLLLAYIGLGSLALGRTSGESARRLAFAGALLVYGSIIALAAAHHAGLLAALS